MKRRLAGLAFDAVNNLRVLVLEFAVKPIGRAFDRANPWSDE